MLETLTCIRGEYARLTQVVGGISLKLFFFCTGLVAPYVLHIMVVLSLLDTAVDTLTSPDTFIP